MNKMDDRKSGAELPDISGIFNVNDSDIPSKLLKKPDRQPNSPAREQRGVIFSEPQEKEDILEKQRAVRRRGNAARKRRLKKRRRIIALISAAAVIAAVFAIKTAIERSKRPAAELYTVTEGAVRSTYVSDAAVITASANGNPISTYAVIPENSYDLNGIKNGQTATITNADGKVYEAHVTSIAEENADTSLTETVKAALTNKTFSAASNIFVYVKADAPMNEADGTVLSVCITTAEVTDVTYVPNECICNDNNGTYVWTVSRFGKVLTKKYVSTSLSANGFTAVTGGLKKNEKTVYKTVTDIAERPLVDGQKVREVSPKIGEETTSQ